MPGLGGEQNPFLRYRSRLDVYRAVEYGHLSDQQFVDLVGQLDTAVGAVGGVRFRITPMIDGAALLADRQAPASFTSQLRLSVKVDIHNVAGSHKARHLFGVALHLLVKQMRTGESSDPLAIASCGNAALAAATIARALDRQLEVFVPTWADESVLSDLDALGATTHRCERRPGEVGDPAYLRFRQAVAGGARAFSVQGTDTPTTFDGGRTLGWEIADQVQSPDSVYVQVGGGALATSVAMALPDARLHPVQAEGCAPLARAWERLAPDFDFDQAAADPDTYMTAWDNPHSLATGILDDITYDWLSLLRLTHDSGGAPVVADEQAIRAAWQAGSGVGQVPVSATGSAGLAGLFAQPPSEPEHVVVIFTGVQRL